MTLELLGSNLEVLIVYFVLLFLFSCDVLDIPLKFGKQGLTHGCEISLGLCLLIDQLKLNVSYLALKVVHLDHSILVVKRLL